MNAQEKWNLLVKNYKENLNCKENFVQESWEIFCSELFGYKMVLKEIDSQRKETIGSSERIIPDIILRKDGKDIIDIELKQYNFNWNEKFEQQLISYMNQFHVSVGIIVCHSIYLYYYIYAENEIKKVEIKFDDNTQDGCKFVELISKENFNTQSIKDFIDEKIKTFKHISEINKLINEEFIKICLKNKLIELYSNEEIDEILKKLHIKISNFNENNNKTELISNTLNIVSQNKNDKLIKQTIIKKEGRPEQLYFWNKLKSILDNNGNPFIFYSTRHWATINKNSSNSNFCLCIDYVSREKYIRVGLYFNTGETGVKQFNNLLNKKYEIEQELGFNVLWNDSTAGRNENTRRIEYHINYNQYATDEIIEKVIKITKKYKDVFEKYCPELFDF